MDGFLFEVAKQLATEGKRELMKQLGECVWEEGGCWF